MIDFNFKTDYGLENEMVSLFPLNDKDFENFLPFFVDEPELFKYSLFQIQGDVADQLERYIDSAMDDRSAGKSYTFTVYDKKTNDYAGSTRFYDIDFEHQTLKLGYTWYGEKFQGTGLNKNCKFLMLEFAFEKLGMQRVEFRADNRNQKSIAAMKSIGCQVEGVLRSNCNALDGRRDSIVLSILQNEWHESVKEKLSEAIDRGKSL